MVPLSVPPCWNSSLPPPLASSVDPDEISALLSKIRSAPWVLSVSPPERANAFSIVRSLVAEASLKSWPLVCKLAKLSGCVLEWLRDALSVVNETLVLVLVQVSATAKLPPRLIVVFEVLNEAPLANVAPIGRPRVPPVEERVPEVALIPPLRVRSAPYLSLASLLQHPVSPDHVTISGIEMLSASESLSVKVNRLAKWQAEYRLPPQGGSCH